MTKREYRKKMNEIKTMQNMKEEINKDTEILKNNQSEMNNLIFQIKISISQIKSLVNRVEQSAEYQEQKRT
jgi:chemotaxis regulatin CheY-phosphate phosphatase CheZ